jgi:hypothetical protein
VEAHSVVRRRGSHTFYTIGLQVAVLSALRAGSWVNPRVIRPLEGLGQIGNRTRELFVTLCLNQLLYRVPLAFCTKSKQAIQIPSVVTNITWQYLLTLLGPFATGCSADNWDRKKNLSSLFVTLKLTVIFIILCVSSVRDAPRGGTYELVLSTKRLTVWSKTWPFPWLFLFQPSLFFYSFIIYSWNCKP